MVWTQEVNPLNNIGLSATVAAVPVIFIFWALIIRKMKGYMASLLTLVVALVVSVFVYGMPAKLALMSSVHGALYGLFPICWIIIGALFLYNITVKSGQFEIIKSFMASITSDRRLQALLIAFSFGAFLEGAAGFGTPVAITAAMLVGLGFNPLYAAGICLIANTAPVAFGSIGTPDHNSRTGIRSSGNGNIADGRKNPAPALGLCPLLPCGPDSRLQKIPRSTAGNSRLRDFLCFLSVVRL